MSSVQTFFERNRTAIIATIAAVGVVGSAAYFLTYSGVPPTSPKSAGSPPGSSGSSSSKKNKKKKKQNAGKTTPMSHGFRTTQDAPDAPAYPVIDSVANVVKNLSDKDRKEIADEFKAAGNYAFGKNQYSRSLELYTKAIDMWDREAIYYSNRAATYTLLQDYDKVVEDTTAALRLVPDYVKCFGRRALAYEKLGNFEEAAFDFTAACVLSNFDDVALGKGVDRVLKSLAESKVNEKFGENDEKVTNGFPGAAFMNSYFRAFHKRELPDEVVNATEANTDGCYDLKLAFDAISKQNDESYKQAFNYLKDAIAKGLPTKKSEALAYEYLGTFNFLCGDAAEGLKNLTKSIDLLPTVQAVIKRSSLHIEMGDLEKAQADFQAAEQLDNENADYHYQMAQLSFLQKDWEKAAAGYKKSLELDDSFLLAHIQLAVTRYRMEQPQVAMLMFKRLLARFPDEPIVHNYYGEVLLDTGDVSGAMAAFDKAIELEQAKNGPAIDVLPLLNKSLAIVQTSMQPEEIKKATDLCRKALAIDPSNEVAVGTLAQFCMQQGSTAEAIELYEKNAELARTHQERVQAYTFAEGARTQQRIHSNPSLRQRLETLARARGV